MLLLLAGCSQPRRTHDARVAAAPHDAALVSEDAGAAAAEVAPEPPKSDGGIEPLTGESVQHWELDDLDVVVVLPIGAREKRPVVVGVHGAADRPELACERWQATLAAFAFVVCPKGVPHRGKLAWGSPSNLAERAERALATLRERYGAYVADGPVTYGGWSLGGTLAPAVVAARPGAYDRAILVEVGHTKLDARKAVSHLKAGRISRVIVSCATRRCLGFAKKLEREWPAAVTINDGGIGRGHLFDAMMFRTLGRTMARNVEGDDRWTGFSEAIAGRFGTE